jgi:hypothetical protein
MNPIQMLGESSVSEEFRYRAVIIFDCALELGEGGMGESLPESPFYAIGFVVECWLVFLGDIIFRDRVNYVHDVVERLETVLIARND